MNIDTMIAAARRRIHKSIERRTQVALGRKPSTANRSAGQLYGKRGKLYREKA